ncbi:DUF4347 domain-containing protein [Amphritea opalescens]|uniref:DUF4347 domain-containing protein n=1 Tax=Amphritea opalescens TaxID=2490544 RepID=A0A430KT83_9GAMM|nr:DUF4347 domain-containing protein [Amphritea opalescens]RTE66722.1 DUF4347 domain-containing protein [Amphritea opalescens]
MSELRMNKAPAMLLLEKAEPRLLLSADPVTSVLSVAMDFSDDIDSDTLVNLDQLVMTDFPDNTPAVDMLTQSDIEYPQSLSPDVGLTGPENGLNASTSVSELIIVDSRVTDTATLLESISPNSQNALTIFINPDHDGVDSITAALNGYSGIQTIHLISHGADGALQLGNSTLNSDTLGQYSDQLNLWGNSLTDTADILIYGCNVAQSAEGEAFVQALSSLTTADIAASDDLTGDALLSGDWQLEYQVGEVDTVTPINLASEAWSGVLASNLWFSTEGDVDSIPQPITWNDTDIVNFEPISFLGLGGFGTSTGGSIEVTGFDIESFIDDEDTNIDAIHHVTTDISIGTGTPIELKAGDILLSLADDQTLDSSDSSSLEVEKEDVFFFRPDTVGDYSKGTFSLLFTNPSDKDITGITLVEETTVVGDTSLQAGSFLFTVDDDGSNDHGIHIFNPGDLSADARDGTVKTLIDGTEEILAGHDLFKDKLTGIELVENDYLVGGVNLEAGTILITLDGDHGVSADNVVSGERQDVFALNMSSTTINASLFFDGSDIGLEESSDSLDAISFYDFQGAANSAPTGGVSIVGAATEDQVLTVDVSSLSDDDGLGTLSYQWQRDGNTIAGATANQYQLDDIDVGTSISVVVSYMDGGGTDEVVVSAGTAAVEAVNDPISGLPQVNGVSEENQQLTANTTGISDVDGLSNSFSYQWQRSLDGANWNDINGATEVNYTLGNADVGQYMRVVVNITDDQGFDEGPLVSSAVGMVSAVNDPITGLPLVSGTAEEDQTLTANTSGISDADGLSNSFSYQWQRSTDGAIWNDVSGATGVNYTLDDADVGQYLRVAVSITDDQGFAEGPLISSATAAIGAVNDPILGLPLISGSAVEDQTLTADTSGISDVDGLSNSFSYQWQRSADGASWSDLAGATGVNYTLDDADVGQYLRVAVSITDDQGFAEGPLVSSATAAIGAVNDPISGLPLISGSAEEDQTLTVDTSGINDVDGLSNSFNYQWQRSADGTNWSDLAGATNATYTLDDADVDQYLRVAVSITDDQGFAEGPLFSSATAAIGAVNDPIAGLPLINGAAEEDQTLTADTSGISDVDGLSNSFSYQWQRSTDGANWSDLAGATNATYTLDDADVGQYLRVAVSITDDQSFDEGPLISSATAAIGAVNDPIVGLPLISGSSEEDQTLTADTSGISDVDGLSNSFNYQWQRSADGANWSDLGGATAATYTLDDADVGQYLRVAVSITDDQNFDEGPLISSATAAIGAVNDPIAGLPTVSGTAEEDQTLTADTSGISDVDGLSNSFNYQWQRSADGANWSDLAGATNATYTLDDADVGQYLRVAVSITDDQGFAEGPLISSATDVIIAMNSPYEGDLVISGNVAVGEVLTLDDTITDADGITAKTYQWYRNGVVISGATGQNYVLTAADVGKEVYVTARYIDLEGRTESVTSNMVFFSVPEVESVAVVTSELEVEASEAPEVVVAAATDVIKSIESAIVPLDSTSAIAPSEATQFVIDAANNEREQFGVTPLNKAIAQEVNTLRFQSVLNTMTQPLALQHFDQFMSGIDQLQTETEEQHALQTMMMGGGIAVSSGLSVGYVIWLARSGVLLSTVLTSLPAWRFIDPLPILSKASSATGYAAEDSEQPDESLSSMVEGGEDSDEEHTDEESDEDDDTDKRDRP